MANFTTHIVVGTLVSGSIATLTLAADVIAPQNLVAVTLAGALGSVLPDIDLKDSRPSRALFSGLAVFFSFAVLFHFAPRLSIAEMWILWIGTFLFVRYGLHTLFHRYAVHRGIWHSILAGIVCAFATAIIFYYALGRPDGVAWLAGGFLLVGFLTHLILDEIYSVDVMDIYIKRSFGTAFKLIDSRNPGATAAMVISGVILLFLVPPITTFAEGISSRTMWAGLHERMLPHDNWFGVFAEHGRLAAAPAEPATQETGSIPAPIAAAPVETKDAGGQR
jgi:hypothetical protein